MVIEDPPILLAKHLSKSFNKRLLFRSISLTIKKGEFVAIVGANGSGKTTLLQTLLGNIYPDTGTIKIFGSNNTNPVVRTRTNIISPMYKFQKQLTIKESLLFYARLYNIQSPGQKIQQLLSIFDLGNDISTVAKAETLSNGELMRAVFCKALLNDPELLFLDEPTAFLDEKIKKKIYKYITFLIKQNKHTFILSTNNLSEAAVFASKIYMFRNKTLTLLPHNSYTELKRQFASNI